MPPPPSPGEQRILTLLGQLRSELLSSVEDSRSQESLGTAAIRHDVSEVREQLARNDAQNTAIWNKLLQIEALLRARPPALPPPARSSPRLDEEAADGVRIAQLTKELSDVRAELAKKGDQERAAMLGEIERFRGSQTYWVRYVIGAVVGGLVALLIFVLTHPK